MDKPAPPGQPLIFRKGLDLKHEVAADLSADYRSAIVEEIKKGGYRYERPGLVVHLAREFGFCYGVDRAVDYAYQARRRFAGRRVYLTGEIIHNPRVNDRLRSLGIRILTDPGESIAALGPDDVVILPAFGVPVGMLLDIERRGCTLVDTTCGSVLNVWKTVKRYAQEGFTAVIHGKFRHEETLATASQTTAFPGGRYLVVRDLDQADRVCAHIRFGGDKERFREEFAPAASDDFDPDRDLVRVGLANQTTMLMSESLAIGEKFRQAMADRYGEAELSAHYRAFETICSATEDRQSAVVALLEERELDLMVVIGGYNSSNTANLARICAERLPAYHIDQPECLLSSSEIRHRPAGTKHEVVSFDWLPSHRPVKVGLTAGASTPDVIVGAVIDRLEELTGTPAPDGPLSPVTAQPRSTV
ncbi:MAG: 4-hydroxy-3-methylbut-2-enyl diphosphate reductase [Vicinamibacterales bacterium]